MTEISVERNNAIGNINGIFPSHSNLQEYFSEKHVFLHVCIKQSQDQLSNLIYLFYRV